MPLPMIPLLVMGALAAGSIGTGIAASKAKGQKKKNLRLASILSGIGSLGAGGFGAYQAGLFPPGTAAGTAAGTAPTTLPLGGSLKDWREWLSTAGDAAQVASVGKDLLIPTQRTSTGGPGPLDSLSAGSTDFTPTAPQFNRPIVVETMPNPRAQIIETTLPNPSGISPVPYPVRPRSAWGQRWGGVGGIWE